jgi:hypothetical protein
MKSLTLRSSIALACALSIAGCGGGGGNLLLGGSVNGLNRVGLVLKNGSDTLTVGPAESTFAFKQLLANDQDFEVTVQTQPDAATCKVENGKGRTSTFNITSVVVSCVTDSYDIGGKVSGLPESASLVLVNGPERQEITANGSFTMTKPVIGADGKPVIGADGKPVVTGKVFVGAPYGVTVLTKPDGKTCTVANAVGTMAKAAVTNIEVSCA